MSELHFPINGTYTVYKDLSVRQWPKDAEDNECKKHMA